MPRACLGGRPGAGRGPRCWIRVWSRPARWPRLRSHSRLLGKGADREKHSFWPLPRAGGNSESSVRLRSLSPRTAPGSGGVGRRWDPGRICGSAELAGDQGSTVPGLCPTAGKGEGGTGKDWKEGKPNILTELGDNLLLFPF